MVSSPTPADDRASLRVVLAVTSEASKHEIRSHAEAELRRIHDIELVARDEAPYHVIYLTHGRSTTARVRTGHVLSSVVTYLPAAAPDNDRGVHGELYRYSELFWGDRDLRTQIDRAVLAIDREVFEKVRDEAHTTRR